MYRYKNLSDKLEQDRGEILKAIKLYISKKNVMKEYSCWFIKLFCLCFFRISYNITIIILSITTESLAKLNETTEITEVEHIDRGYPQIEEKLKLLGVDIIRK